VDTIVLVVFVVVYLGMLLGEIPGLALDRTGVALLGALALVATERVTPADAWRAVDVPTLALASTLAGNLLIVGSIANIIVVDQAGALGVRIGWREHARVGIPVTLATLALAAGWLAWRAS
jgi:Na+/H+ antiporter NhaD/arsenite permease-like protein